MLSEPRPVELVNPFALVSYIPEPLRALLDDVRLEIAPGCRPAAHVTVLPPRSILVEPTQALEELRAAIPAFGSIDVQLGEIKVFGESEVVYLDIVGGREQLERLHDALNLGGLRFQEPYAYHPHVTLGQKLPNGGVWRALNTARERWRDWMGPRSFSVEELAFVQNVGDCWFGLGEIPLGTAAQPVRKR